MKKRRVAIGSQLVTALVVCFLLVGLPAGAQGGKKKENAQGKASAGMQMMEGREMGMSKFNFDDTVSKIKAGIEAHQMMILLTPDHQQMLAMVGLQTKPMMTIEFFHPRYGKTIFQNDGRAALEVPLRIAIMENEQGQVMYQYNRPSYVFSRYNSLGDLGKELDKTMEEIVGEVKMKM
jgi:uncharacterized protein (DUF302 family)